MVQRNACRICLLEEGREPGKEVDKIKGLLIRRVNGGIIIKNTDPSQPVKVDGETISANRRHPIRPGSEIYVPLQGTFGVFASNGNSPPPVRRKPGLRNGVGRRR